MQCVAECVTRAARRGSKSEAGVLYCCKFCGEGCRLALNVSMRLCVSQRVRCAARCGNQTVAKRRRRALLSCLYEHVLTRVKLLLTLGF